MAYPYRPYKPVFTAEEVIQLCKNADLEESRKSDLISHYRPPFTDFFSGRQFQFTFDNGINIQYRFQDAHTLLWSVDGIHIEEEYYEALESTVKNVFLVHHIRHQTLPYEGLTLIIDMDAELVSWINLTLGTDECDKNVRRKIFFGYFGQKKGERHTYTEELCGVILDWKYTDDFIIRHEYITPYSVLSPGEPTDDDEAYLFRKILPACYVKIRPDLYIVSFIEDGGSEIALLIDLTKVRDIGAFFGLSGDGRFSSFTIGAVAGRGTFGFTGKYSINYGPEPKNF